MGRRSAEKQRAAKDAKQKKVLFVLIPVFLLLLVWQGPGYLSMITGGGEEAAPAETPTATTTTPSSTTPVDPGAPPSTAAGSPGTETTVTGAANLPDSDVPVTAGSGQLVTFDLFSAKNPFEQQVDEAVTPPTDTGSGGDDNSDDPSGGGSFTGGGDGSDGSGTGSGGSGTGSGGSGTGSGGSGTGSGGSGNGSGGSGNPQTATAALTVNGTAERVAAGGAFPASDPLFRVASIGASSVQIGLVSGSFSDGSKTMKLAVGRKLTLVSQPDGLRYTIKLVSIS